MRGRQDPPVTMLAFIDPERREPPDHPLRTVRTLEDRALVTLSPEFDRMDAEPGRPSIPPESRYVGTEVVAADRLYLVRSERAFCEQGRGEPAVPLVPGREPDRAELRPDGLPVVGAAGKRSA